MSWLKDFNGQTAEKAAGRTRYVYLDGHNSHFSLPVLRYAKEHHIELLGYPPHTTHALQGLDVVCFAKFKAAWQAHAAEYHSLHHHKVKKEHLAEVFGKAFLASFTEDTIRAAFSSTGICPFNPDVITAEQMKPSHVTSIKAALPISMSSPVRAIVSAFAKHPPTRFEAAPDHNVQDASASYGQTLVPNALSRSSVEDKTSTEILEASYISKPVDSSSMQDSPSKHIRIAYSNLAATNSGSFLVNNMQMLSTDTLPTPNIDWPNISEPNWVLKAAPVPLGFRTHNELEEENHQLRCELQKAHLYAMGQRAMLEAANAQLVLANLHTVKLNQSLHTKENKREKRKNKFLQAGMGRYYTCDEFIAEEERVEEVRKAEKAAKDKRREDRNGKKRAKNAQNMMWREARAKYDRDMEFWSTNIAHLKANNVPPRYHPDKPRFPKKADLFVPDPEPEEVFSRETSPNNID
jgi:hypothetical protein